MKNYFIRFSCAGKSIFKKISTGMFTRIICVLFVFSSFAKEVFSQGIIPTKGKEFWVGFPYAPGLISGNPASKRCELFITSEVNTSGTVAIPQQAWIQNFTVTANQTTTVTIPVNMVEHLTSEVVENMGVEILSADTVSVFAISFQQVSADATVVYPKQSLGTEYRVCGYPGINVAVSPGLNSELLVVATVDGTQVSITPTAATTGGNAVGVPFIVNLDAGQSYQVLAANYQGDLTGSVVKATDSSGSCRPFAVFAGSTCVNIPNGCTACDVLYEQQIPVSNWGNTFYSIPFSGTNNYTLRVLADKNNTSYSINGGPATLLNAGQFTEINNITTASCITSNQPICVAQYMQGNSCSGGGDPSMMYLNAHDQKIDEVTFSTITSTVINQHYVNIIANTPFVNQVMLDGVPVPAASFSPIPGCPNVSFAQVPLSQGSHTLAADSGITAYAYGTGSYESYAYSVGSFSKTPPIIVDSIVCTSDTIQLGSSVALFNPWWSTASNPGVSIATGHVLTLTPPIIPDIYILQGDEFISGCTVAKYFAIETPIPPTISATSTATTACQNQLVQLSVNVNPASSIYQYSWTPTTGLNNPNVSNPVLTATSSGWYRVAVSSPNGCIATLYDSVYVDVLALPLPLPNGGIDQTICPGSSANLSASGGVSYLWNPGGHTTSSITVSPSVTTSYIVHVTDSNGCGNSDTVNVILSPAINGSAGADQTVCAGGSAQLNATGGTSYSWIIGGGSLPNLLVTPDSTTNYVVQIFDATGCFRIDTVTVFYNQIPVANAGPDVILCTGQPVTLTATGGSSYLWQPGNQTTAAIQVNPATTTSYVVRVSDAFGCAAYDTVLITVNPLFTGSMASQTICLGEIITLTDSGGISYLWTPTGSTDSSIIVSPSATTDYVVEVVKSNGCIKLDTVRVHVNPLPAANAGSDVALCQGQSTTLIASGGNLYQWLGTGNNTNSLTVTPAGTLEYIVEVTDNNGCRQRDSVIVTVHPLPIVAASPDVTLCLGSSATLQASGGISYHWMPGGSTSSSIVVTPSSATDYTVDVTDANGCRNSDTIEVGILPSPDAQFDVSGSVCENNFSFFQNHSSVAGGVILNSDWDFGDGNSSTLANLQHSYSQVGNYNVRLIVTDNNGCIDSISKQVNVNPVPVVAFTAVDSCVNTPVLFSDQSFVSSGSVTQWLWDFGDGTSDTARDPGHLYDHPGTYHVSLVVTTDSGCTAGTIAPQSVNIHPIPQAQFTATPAVVSILQPEVACFETGHGGVSRVWDFGDGSLTSASMNPVHVYSDTGHYLITLVLTASNGCMDTAYGDVYVEAFFSVYFPNAFTPNGDGINEVFLPTGEGIRAIDLHIFDRWGGKVYRQFGTAPSWDGMSGINEENFKESVYVFQARVIDYAGRRFEYTGSVTLIR